MATVAELRSCDGFAVEAAGGLLGWVEETWLDGSGHPGALAVRTPDGRRGLLLAGGVAAVDPDAQEVLVGAGAVLHELDAPRIESTDGDVTATWHTTGALVAAVPAAAAAQPAAPALAASRAATAHVERPFWQVVALALGGLATLVSLEIGIAFLAAWIATGHAY